MSDCTIGNEDRLDRICTLSRRAATKSSVTRDFDDPDHAVNRAVLQDQYDAMVREIKALTAEL